ncbi:arginase family protein [Parendozoicomonas haliclonae]|uniref:N(1)-aminopropylagmatine ureohydrolase n=1 Tax=Parendozoicomonas haliclonae TaxID=1960125 RepID=A0A1X7AQS4_9GAMM|nr:arginase family protein [Parendozoicomonas haliclonae]SMA49757.1 N(1)-aminopropylagmatine ureohydrolase [Parendozoicomonas haliclonae]
MTTPSLQDAVLAPTSQPVRCFLDWPVITDPQQWEGNVALIGVQQSEPYPADPQPSDQATAPDAVRLQSYQFCDGPDQWDFDINTTLSSLTAMKPFDCGNINFDSRKPDQYPAFAEHQVALLEKLWRSKTQVIMLGGDHGVTTPALQALNVIGEPVHVVHIDAHLDWREEKEGVKGGYSSPLRRASEMPWISHITQIGMRGTGSARRKEMEDAVAWGADIIPALDVHMEGVKAICDRLPKGRKVYLTIDADGLDASHMPGVLAPQPGGLYKEQVAVMIQHLAKHNDLVGMDIVEIAPSFDFKNAITCITAGRLIINALGATWKDRD